MSTSTSSRTDPHAGRGGTGRSGTGLLGLVRRHPTVTFFALAFGLSWAAWLPYVLSVHGLGVLDLRYPELLGNTQLAGMLPGAYVGPLGAAFTVTAVVEGRAGLRAWARRLTHWRVGWRWYAAVLTGVPAAILLATIVLPGAWEGAAPVPAVALVAYLPVLVMQLVTTAAAEEPGWRDFALPRLQRSFGPVLGTTVLGVLWGAWHLPMFLTADWGGYPDVSWVEPAEFVAAAVPVSIVMTWVFNRTQQSLPIVMVLHASINTFCSLIWLQAFPGLDPSRDTLHVMLIAATAVAVVLLVATRGRLGLQVHDVPERTLDRGPAPAPAPAPAAR
ncbi:CPBP family intramembrane glutamic endopeptidase [Quadrisphaera sp. DSM 44207]|uniref:CPBP family intramembrane glutamic endopeptidase n=1 Tax=Quadrisphaera sp. DSM 44207 TaxID=1881057 RepID=UPI00088D3842|nr:CPBP family intramembrane glutamic endopeptidase [Quadrisphaera sp. DSM 44207]SDQ07029.1 CAAX protease self-immunity [Quadrisphaera sp. DSM 44207]